MDLKKKKKKHFKNINYTLKLNLGLLANKSLNDNKNKRTKTFRDIVFYMNPKSLKSNQIECLFTSMTAHLHKNLTRIYNLL